MNLKHLAFEWRRIGKMPRATIFCKAIARLISLILGLLLLPLTLLLHLAGYRHVTIFTDRIGHLAIEPDCLLKEQALGHIRPRKWIMLASPGRIANEHLLTYWQPYFHILRSPLACFMVASMSRFGLMRQDVGHYTRAIGKAQASYHIYAEWADRPPILKLSPEVEIWGKEQLKALGLPENAWFVCVHAREGGFSPIDEELHTHRNSRIENTFAAMAEIVRRGGWVIRIGDTSMTPLPSMPNVVDYAHHPLKSPRLDIFLCARARFILASTSGIALVGSVFGVPCALANMVPLSALGVGIHDISIPKLYWLENEKRYLRFNEVFTSPLSCAQYSRAFANAGIRLEENSMEDIQELALEMFDHLENHPNANGHELQKSFLALLQDHHYAYGAASTVSARFLLRHRMLIDPDRLSKMNTQLAIHHIGARGPTQAFATNPAFDTSIVNVLYEADPDCIDEVKQLNSNRAAKVIVLNECISGTGGPRTFCDAHHGYGSSLLEANIELKSLYIPAHWIDYDYTVYEAVSAQNRRQIETRTLDQIIANNSEVPLPDFLSLDTQGSELEILQGSPSALQNTVCIVTEVEFMPLYEKQPLFGDISAFLSSQGFIFARFFKFLNGALYRTPIGLRGNGFPVTTDALFLRDPRTISNSNRSDPEKALSLAKLAFFSLAQGYLEHALWALKEAERHAWKELVLAENWHGFMRQFSDLAKSMPELMPETFAERYGLAPIGKEAFAEHANSQITEVRQKQEELLALLREYHFDEAAKAIAQQTEIDLKRLAIQTN